MKTQEQIEELLQGYLIGLDSLKDWCDKAAKKYIKEKEIWGNQADGEEWKYANDEYNKIKQRVTILKWVLELP